MNINEQGLDSDDISSLPCIGDIAHLFINPIYDAHIPKNLQYIGNFFVFFFLHFLVLGHF